MSPAALETSVVERRSGERVDRVVAIRHRLANTEDSDWSLSTTKNMSHSGLLFLSSTPYRKNDVVELQVIMSGVIDIYNGKAEVRRVNEVGSTSFDVGVKFVYPKNQARNAKSHFKQ